MKKVNLAMEKGKRKDSGILVLEGNLTLDCVDEILHFFLEAAEKYRDLDIRVKSAEALDLGFLQLLHSLEARQKEKGAEFHIDMALEKETRQLLLATGFSRWLGESQLQAK